MQILPVAELLRSGRVDGLILFQADLDRDGNPEYILAADYFNTVMAAAFRLEDNAWRELQLTPDQNVPEPGQSLTDGEIEVIPPEFNNLQIGDITLRVLVQ